LGPMVVAAVALDANAARKLRRAGLADSKKFAGAEAIPRRAELAALIRQHAHFIAIEVVEPEEIDERVARHELNLLERERARHLIQQAPRCARIIADGKNLFGQLRTEFPELRAYDRGESRHAAVAAASIIAKHERDAHFARLCDAWRPDFGDIAGGGYLNPPTRAFLRAYRNRFGDLPTATRRSWSTEF